MDTELHVYLSDHHVGVLEPHPADRRRARLRIDQDFTGGTNALSEGFAVRPSAELDGAQIANFFGGYLPDGAHRASLAERTTGLRDDDLSGLLRAGGLTMAGALSVRPEPPDERVPADYRPLTPNALHAKIVTASPYHDLGNEQGTGRSSIAGFQTKLLLAQFDGRWHQPLNAAHSTHIIKPIVVHRPHLIHDEFYSHELTRYMGLSSFGSELSSVSGVPFLAIQRYDREVHENQRVTTIHQEDAAQILGLDWVNSYAKFQDRGAPNRGDRASAAAVAEIFGSIGDGADVGTWLAYLTYNILVGNHDAHAKNVSVLHEADGSARISDLYDAVPMLHINDRPSRAGAARVHDTMALSIGREFQHHSLTREHLLDEASSWGSLTDADAANIIDRTLHAFSEALDATVPPTGASSGLRDRLNYNLTRIAAGKAIGRPKLPIAGRRS